MSIRKPFAALCASLLAATLLGLGFSWSAWHVLSQPDYIKKTLRTSGIYQSFIDDVIKQKANEVTASGELPANQPEVQSLVKQAFTPELLQSQAEGVIDGSFDWAQGKTATLNTNIDLTAAKQKLADSMAAYAENRVKSLPTCTAATMPAATVDVLQATCVPPGFDATAAANQARDNVLNGDFLKDTKLSADEIQTSNGQTLQQQLHDGPVIYQKIKWTVYAQAILAAILAIGLVVFSSTKRIGIRRVGVISIWTGALNAGLAWLSSYGVHYISHKLAQTNASNQPLQQKVFTIVQGIMDDIKVWWLWYSLVVFGIGVVLVLVYRFTQRTPKEQAAFLAEDAGIDLARLSDTAPTGTPKMGSGMLPSRNAKPARPPRKIQ